ncbi:uncharacterized protein LOC115441218 [Manduca sexta]|uniref:Uncharacterized protein n=1 Tax=Manduca sexta TaxID=7130 RepID=A0A921YKK2_MANSE|nr:uncharacterized protein LOC115441218 [Manduca sexta]KAG6440851.1 hypothetical protein O3G_MSEX001464 [Manduca sexta]
MDEANLSAPYENPDIPESAASFTERPNTCPLCNSTVKLFYINFTEKIFMCENTDCEYPFGHEDIKFYKYGQDLQIADDVSSNKSRNTASVAASTISSSAWADIEQMNKIYESEECQFDTKATESKEKNIKTKLEKEIEAQLSKNVANIKELTKELSETAAEKGHCIKNEKWLKNLMNKQTSGMKLLRQGEITKLKKTELALGATELKIDIDPSKNNVSSITINLTNQ